MISISEIERFISADPRVDFDPEGSQLIVDITHSRGPAPDKALSSIKAALKPRPADLPQGASQVIFVIDKSGSMQGINFTVARRVFDTIYNALDPNTSVSILLFNDVNQIIQLLLTDGTRVTKGLKSAINFEDLTRQLDSIRPEGNTNIIGCLKDTAYLVSGTPGVKPTIEQINAASVVFITDGVDNLATRYKRPRIEVDLAAAPRPPVVSKTEAMMQLLLPLMREEYGVVTLPRIIPIGIGLSYDSELLISLGAHPVFHRSGFLHLTQVQHVAERRAALLGLVNPYRLKSCLFVRYKNGENKLYPEMYLQEEAVGVKEHLFDDTAEISEIYIATFRQGETLQVLRIMHSDAGFLKITTLRYDDELLKKYILSENSAMALEWRRADDRSSLEHFKPALEKLLRNYTKAYWRKDRDVIAAIESLTKIYIELTDTIAKRGPARTINPLLDLRRRSEDEERRELAAYSATSASCAGPAASASACPWY